MSQAAQEIIADNTDTTPYHKDLSIDDITDLMEIQGLNITQVAKRLNCNESSIRYHLNKHDYKPDHLVNYKKYRADILAKYQLKILESITEQDLEKAGLSQKVMAYGVLFDKERLQLGQSTENIAYADMVKVNAKIKSEMEGIAKQLGIEPQLEPVTGD